MSKNICIRVREILGQCNFKKIIIQKNSSSFPGETRTISPALMKHKSLLAGE